MTQDFLCMCVEFLKAPLPACHIVLPVTLGIPSECKCDLWSSLGNKALPEQKACVETIPTWDKNFGIQILSL